MLFVYFSLFGGVVEHLHKRGLILLVLAGQMRVARHVDTVQLVKQGSLLFLGHVVVDRDYTDARLFKELYVRFWNV